MGKYVADFDGKVKVWEQSNQIFVSLTGGHLGNEASLSVKADSPNGKRLNRHIAISRLDPHIKIIESTTAAKVQIGEDRISFEYGYGRLVLSYRDTGITARSSGQHLAGGEIPYVVAQHAVAMTRLLGWTQSIDEVENSQVGVLIGLLVKLPQLQAEEFNGGVGLKSLGVTSSNHDPNSLWIVRVGSQLGAVMQYADAALVQLLIEAQVLPGTAPYVALSENVAVGSTGHFLDSTPMAFALRKSDRDARVYTGNRVYEQVMEPLESFFTTARKGEEPDRRDSSLLVRVGQDTREPGWSDREWNALVWQMMGEAARLDRNLHVAEVGQFEPQQGQIHSAPASAAPKVERVGSTVIVEIEGANPRGINDDVSDEQLRLDIARAQAVLERRAQERTGTVPDTEPTAAQVAREFIKDHPGCSTDELIENCQVPCGLSKDWIVAVARESRAGGFGMLLDGQWFTAGASQQVDVDIRHGRMSEGCQRLLDYYDTPAEYLDHRLHQWGLKHA